MPPGAGARAEAAAAHLQLMAEELAARTDDAEQIPDDRLAPDVRLRPPGDRSRRSARR